MGSLLEAPRNRKLFLSNDGSSKEGALRAGQERAAPPLATSCVSGVQRAPNGSEYLNPQISAQQDLGGPGNLHFWPEILSREPEAARIPRGPTGQGGSEGVGLGSEVT